MSVRAIQWALLAKTGSPTTKAVLLVLADTCNHEGICWPGQEYIAVRAEVSVRSVRNHLEVLESAGLLSRRKRGRKGGGRTSDEYFLNIPDEESNQAKVAGLNQQPVAGLNRNAVADEPPVEPPTEQGSPDGDPSEWMHECWERQFGTEGRLLALTPKRRQKYRAMFTEQLASAPDPTVAWRAVLYAVSQSDHHMSDRAYQMPESLLLNPERRDRWVDATIRALNSRGSRPGDESASRRREELLDFLKSRRPAA